MSQAVLAWSETIVIRSWKSCALWFFATALPAALLLLNKLELTQEGRFLAELFVAFGTQAFISELLGMRAHADAVSFPRRPFPLLPLALWRRNIPLKHISRVDSIDDSAVRLYLTSCERFDFLFPDKESKSRALRYLGKANATLNSVRKRR
jgi:hypothetical protein